jgi:mono/diheme cytochrome c family protein
MARRGGRLIALSLAAAVVIAAPPAWSAEVGDPAIGKLLAQTWCGACHAISGAQRRSGDVAPPFAALVNAPGGRSDARLRGWLHDPHPPMQGITLSRQQVEDIVAYLHGLVSQ